MAEFNLKISIDAAKLDVESLEQYLEPYVEDTDEVTFAETDDQSDSDPERLESVLEIDDIDTFADLYTELQDTEEPLEIGLWGPTAERFPVPVQHYALQQISTPDAYHFHALDHKVTLVIADSQQRVQQLRQEVPPPALG